MVMARRGRKPLPAGTARKHRVICFLSDEELEMLMDVAGYYKMEPHELVRAAVFDRVSAAIDDWGEKAAAKIVADRAHEKWLKECSDPEGAVQWALGDKPLPTREEAGVEHLRRVLERARMRDAKP